ncbi:hypothetical protein Ae406Ps2_0996 [Pseudonocardia sp. Ae406_Ps2]|uniref:hypothetical protein n=1 Tax=unclassified Pseudonocardia TaxID=2619320 RepID=UPI00094B3E9C|nr:MULTISPECIES: hypothetical protein [unclassified Pseudonocardia]OLM00996.1 hypothetical protein Ae406Ps2_0996 [Pseudonocardia sp. Ae406_Ps2]OLM07209.1 hypothetical protein Ae331Ps2_4919c [Pseudonocardia sp. Ae331_Ps2]OLM14403.1 hypothetical protein Ae505Ps2_4533c [Pseudonocardia sp. Ae505_Ps2]OLM22574.1 hypothetical protein Ae706Ps2_1006 [Pseudonocardia sp. Ae706_Ps2]OLM31567.1 hypothetical protein Ae717Ps2_2462c [Pseudonocardia sp. Ae717_Ps2]
MDANAELDLLYRVPPEDFVAARAAAVARARAEADTDSARAIAAARRPTRAAWLANLLVDDARDEVEGLLALAPVLADAQRSLDGAALREVSAQRTRLVGALARRAAALGRAAGARVDPGLERDVRWVLESALADPELADRVRSGRLERYERHSGFGPLAEPDSGPPAPRTSPPRTPPPPTSPPRTSSPPTSTDRDAEPAPGTGAPPDTASRPDGDGELSRRRRDARRREAERRAAEEQQRRAAQRHARALAEAEKAVETARLAAHDTDREREDTRDRAAQAAGRRDDAHRRVAELTAELARARDEAEDADRARDEAERAARDAAARADRAGEDLARAEEILDGLRSD